MKKIVATIEARMTSTRLPGKVLKPILGRPMLQLLIERLKRSKFISEIVVATTVNIADEAIVEAAHGASVSCYRGSENDVLDRVLQAARSVNSDIIVEITGDCPLIDPEIVDFHVDTYLSKNVDYVSNCMMRTYPHGMDTQVFSTQLLAEVANLTQDNADREHVSLYIYSHPEKYRLYNIASGLPGHPEDYRLTVDTPDDFELIRRIYEELYPKKPSFDMRDILDLFARTPNLVEINRHVKQRKARE